MCGERERERTVCTLYRDRNDEEKHKSDEGGHVDVEVGDVGQQSDLQHAQPDEVEEGKSVVEARHVVGQKVHYLTIGGLVDGRLVHPQYLWQDI